jgi:glycosyltransferase involved in cell wall biosynthesis
MSSRLDDAAAGNRAGSFPSVSIVTPFFDAGGFLEEAILSVVGQTISDWELLLVDDGSSDESVRVARRYAESNPHQIRYLQHQPPGNRGKSVARNLAIAEARGKYLTFLDADDVLMPRKLEHQIRLLGAYPEAIMVYGNTEYWHSWNSRRGRTARDTRGRLGVPTDREYRPPELLTAWLKDPGIVPCLCAVLVRTSTVREVGAFDESIQDLFEDQVLLAKLLLAGSVYVESGCHERYRQHANSSSSLAIASGHYHPTRSNPARLIYLQWLQQHLQARGLLTSDLECALRRTLRSFRYPRVYAVLQPLRGLIRRLRLIR